MRKELAPGASERRDQSLSPSTLFRDNESGRGDLGGTVRQRMALRQPAIIFDDGSYKKRRDILHVQTMYRRQSASLIS
jgi:hypothetical protein